MTGRNVKKDYYDPWEGLEQEGAFSIEHSQCKDCLNKVKVKGCKVFGERPHKYMSVLAKVKCPERKVR